jgi:hypothetical protein
MRAALVITRRSMRFIWLCYFSLVLAACNAGNMEPSNHHAEPAQSESQGGMQAEDVLGGGAGDYFGYAVAISGDHALVGQPHDQTRGLQAGAAYFYERQGDVWKEVSMLMPDDATANDLFGITVALNGHIAAVGAPGANHSRGVVYVFERQDGAWRQVQRLTVSQTQPNDNFAIAIALSGTYLFTGAPGDSEAGEQAGAVYVFERQDGFWSTNEVQKLLAYTAEPGAQFGRSVAIAGVSALVGAPAHDGTGAAYVFERRDGVWTETTQVQAGEGQPGDHFGHAVATSGAIAVVGAPHHGHTGAVYLLEHQASGWPSIAVDPLTASDRAPGAQFGGAVAIAGRVVLVGAYSDGDTAHRDTSGTAYLFTGQPGEAWRERYQFPQADEQRSPHFGYAVALTGPYVLIGAPAILTGANGHVYPYRDLLADTASETIPSDRPSPPAPPLPAEDAPPVSEDVPGDMPGPEVNRAPRITSTPITRAEMLHVMPEITVTDPHLSQQTITLNGQPFTPGTAITAAGSYELTVEATDAAGNTSHTTVRFAIEPPDSP